MVHTKVYELQRSVVKSKIRAVEYATKEFLTAFPYVTLFETDIQITLPTYFITFYWEVK